MSQKEEKIQLQGVIEECLPNTEFLVKITDEKYPDEMTITGYLAGKMKMNFIKILPGDKVTVEVSPYNLEKGRIVYRFK